MKSKPFQFTEDMHEISGLGGAHERALRAAVSAGAMWFSLHPDADPIIEGDDIGCRGANADGESLLRAINGVLFAGDDGVKVNLGTVLTSSMYYAALYHIVWIAEHGWDDYASAMHLPLRIFEEGSAQKKRQKTQ